MTMEADINTKHRSIQDEIASFVVKGDKRHQASNTCLLGGVFLAPLLMAESAA